MMDIKIIDNALRDPHAYRENALKLPFQTFDFGHVKFHGIAPVQLDTAVPKGISELFEGAKPTLSFFRKSPQGQVEPHFIHTDADMGEWSAILYLNPDPAPEDGTDFWKHKASGEIGNAIPHDRSEEGNDIENWELRERVAARFNRMVIFPSVLYHSRAIFDNYGEGDEARLTQVTFGNFKENS